MIRHSQRKLCLVVLLCLFLSFSSAKDFLKDDCEDKDEVFNRWIEPNNDKKMTCNLEIVDHFCTSGQCFCGGLSSKEEIRKNPERFMASTTKMIEKFNTEGEEFVFQFAIGLPISHQCGEAELRLLPEGHDPESFNDDSPYQVRIKYERCGGKSTAEIYLNRYGELFKLKSNITIESQRYFSSMYRLIIRNDKYFDFVLAHTILKQGYIDEDFELVSKKMEDLSQETKDKLYYGVGLGTIAGVGVIGETTFTGESNGSSDIVFSYIHLTNDSNEANAYQGWFDYVINNRLEYGSKFQTVVDEHGQLFDEETSKLPEDDQEGKELDEEVEKEIDSEAIKTEDL